MNTDHSVTEKELYKLQKDTFRYFTSLSNPENGLVPDNTRTDSPCSIAAVGLALSCYPIAAERSFVSRKEAASRTLTTLRFFWQAEQSTAADATGYKGFFYHFLDMKTGKRTWKSELSTIDSSFVFAGALTAAAYFDRKSAVETEIRNLADKIYRRANWQWVQDKNGRVSHGWTPERKFLRYHWDGYSEGIILMILGLGSPTFPLKDGSYAQWLKKYSWKKLYEFEFLYAAPLFIHQLTHIWIDFRGIQDQFMRKMGIDYFENSRRATYVQQAYAIRNPKKFEGYGKFSWGITASDGPGPAVQRVNGIVRRFYDYKARGVPYGPDDGTLAPWGVAASLPFAPEIVLPTLHDMNRRYPHITGEHGYKCSFNPSFHKNSKDKNGWRSKGHYGLDQGPVVLMIENFRTGLIWRLNRSSPYIIEGLRRAGFTGGWLTGRLGLTRKRK
jgi:hypothetical protein